LADPVIRSAQQLATAPEGEVNEPGTSGRFRSSNAHVGFVIGDQRLTARMKVSILTRIGEILAELIRDCEVDPREQVKRTGQADRSSGQVKQ